MTTIHLLKREWDWHKTPGHLCGYGTPNVGRCPAVWNTYQDFLASRGFPEFPVDLEMEPDFGQISGQTEFPVRIPASITGKTELNCHVYAREFDPRLDQVKCLDCGEVWNSEHPPESHTIDRSGTSRVEVDASASDISLMVQSLSVLLDKTNALLEELVEQGKRTPVVVAVDPSKSNPFNSPGMTDALELAKRNQ